MEPILEVENLGKKFKNFSLNNISFSLGRGYITGFIGPNGAGKSTTIKLILNLLKRDGGEIKIFGLDNIQHEIEIKNRLGFVFDENYYYEELTVSEMKRAIAPFYRNWDEGTFNRYIKEFNLPAKKKIKELSKGMKMKFSLAMALSHDAELLIMDEPTSGLDPLIRSEFLDILRHLIQDENKSVFFSTHITSDLEKVADYIIMIDDGDIILSTDKDDIVDNYGIVKGGKELLDSEAQKQFISVRENKFGFEGLVRDREQAKRYIKGNIVIDKPSLEDVMLYFTRRKQNV